MTTSPVSLQDLRRRIYVTAKADKTKRFWGLHVHVVKRETLRTAYALRKKATLNAAHRRRHTAASAGVSRPTADKKFFDLEVHDLHAIAIGVVAPPKVDAAVGDGEQPVVGERDAVGVVAEVGEHMFRPGERRLAVDDPRLLAERVTEPRVVQGALECFQELGWIRPEALRAPDGGRPTVRFHLNPRFR